MSANEVKDTILDRSPTVRLIKMLYFAARKYWLVLVCSAVSIGGEAFRIAAVPAKYIAQGKLAAGVQVVPRLSNAKGMELELAEIYDTQIEILKSGELRRRALERVRGEHPELKEITIDLVVTRTKGSSILKAAAVGEEPKFTRAYLDSLLVEYIAFRREAREKAFDSSATNKIIEQVLIKEREVRNQYDALNDFLKSHDALLLEKERDRLAGQVSLLRGQVAELKLSGTDSPKALETMKILEQVERQFQENSEQYLRLQVLKSNYDAAGKDYQDWKKSLERLAGVSPGENSPLVCDTIFIMERPAIADELEPDYVLPLAMAGILGALVGFFLRAMVSLFLARPSLPLPQA